jgi:uncharacterized UBP type Zn finger protein
MVEGDVRTAECDGVVSSVVMVLSCVVLSCGFEDLGWGGDGRRSG